MKTVEYSKMTDGTAKSGSEFLEAAVGALDVGDVVIKKSYPSARAMQRSRGIPKVTVEKFVVTGIGGEFYSQILNCDAVRAYCDKTITFEELR